MPTSPLIPVRPETAIGSASAEQESSRLPPSSTPQQRVLEAIRQAQTVLVSAHTRPDGDAIGSMLACGAMLQQLDKQVDLVSSDRVPLIYQWLPAVHRIVHASAIERTYDLVILLECDGIERSRLKGLEGQTIVNIDHHASGRPFANINWIDPDAGAVAEMICDLATLAGAIITPDMATCLYTAVLTDTGSFCYEGTSGKTLELAAGLVRKGASPSVVAQEVYFSNPLSKMVLLGAALSNLRREGRIAWLWVTHEDMQRTSAAEEDCEGIVNYAIGIAGVEVAVFLRELPDHRVRLSLRSKGIVNVAQAAEIFGGGGHVNAAGCTLAGPLPVATRNVVEMLKTLR